MARCTVLLSPEMAEQMAKLKVAREKSKAKRGLYDALHRCAVVYRPEHAGHQLHQLGPPYTGVVYRVKQARLRMFYAHSRADNRAVLLFVGNRKDGDKDDAYEVLGRRIRRGDFDAQFEELGLARPKVK